MLTHEGKDCISGLLEYSEARRNDFPKSLRHAWIAENETDLNALYKRFVIQDHVDPPPRMPDPPAAKDVEMESQTQSQAQYET